MKRCARLCCASVIAAFILIASGCGRPTLPGQQFKGPRQTLPGVVGRDTPLPEEPFYEWGPENAKVQIEAFYPIDERHQRLVDLLKKAATEEYPGKLHVMYIDYRTPEGAAMMRRAEIQVAAMLFNGENSVDLEGPVGVRTVDFVRDIGRFWTEDDLKQAIEHEIAKAYGPQAVRAAK